AHVIRAANQHGNCDFTLFEGREVTGTVHKVFLRGELIVDGDRWLGRAGSGRYVPRGESGGW
ncbi:MAG: dihydropyrimidinase, partial [Bordetella sp.]|nr:dihydropyrimidinase [Bordetella sp.]